MWVASNTGRHAVYAALLLALLSGRTFGQPVLSPAFGDPQKETARVLIEEVAGTAADFPVDDDLLAAYLDTFWLRQNPLLHRYYYGHYLGVRRYSVSDAFFERGRLIPKTYHAGFPPSDSIAVREGLGLADLLVSSLPEDAAAHSARGYLLLEAGNSEKAESSFREAVRLDDGFAEAHNGWGLSFMPQPKRLTAALYHFRDAIALDPKYAAALYNLALCQLAMGSIDLDHRFRMVIDRFPDHHDAYYKLGVTYERHHNFKKAAGAYSNQTIANPNHDQARARLARVNLEMSWTNKRRYDIPELNVLVDRDPFRYLPLLAETHLAKRNYKSANRAYVRYFRLLRGDVRAHYEDISLFLSEADKRDWQSADKKARKRNAALFWLMADPTPTTPINERRLEHYRRVHYARQNFGDGQKPWDRRGEVYIRLGHPDHRSWSGNIVFETRPDVVRVKNRLNNLTFRARRELLPDDLRFGGEGLYPSREFGEIRGIPVFPVPHTGSTFRDGASLDARWESWIYAHVDRGIELSFVDLMGSGLFDFALPPAGSPNSHIWRTLAPETIYAAAKRSSPDHFTYDYGGPPLTVHSDHATFRGSGKQTALEFYLGIPSEELGLEQRGNDIYGRYDRTIVIYQAEGKVVFRDSARLIQPVDPSPAGENDGLLISQTRRALTPGTYVVGVEVRDPGTGRRQVLRRLINVGAYSTDRLAISDIEVAGMLNALPGNSEDSADAAAGTVIKNGIGILPLPSRTFRRGKPVYLYYEVYGLLRDADGRTRYRVDYQIEGARAGGARRLTDRVARFLGNQEDQEAARISYQYEGTEASEPLYVALDLEAVGSGRVSIAITVTDLKQLDEPSATRSVTIQTEGK